MIQYTFDDCDGHMRFSYGMNEEEIEFSDVERPTPTDLMGRETGMRLVGMDELEKQLLDG